MLTIVGGAYRELCLDPKWDYLFGSGVRAAAAVSALAKTRRRSITLHTWVTKEGEDQLRSMASSFGFNIIPHLRSQDIEFQYDHPLGPPRLYPRPKDILKTPNESFRTQNALVFGLVEGTPSISAERLVFDPQAGMDATSYRSHQHSAKSVAIVANLSEVKAMLSGFPGRRTDASPSQLAKRLLKKENADVVVLKNGAEGAIVATVKGITAIPSFESATVFPIGSGDIFSGVFALYWAEFRKPPQVAALHASAATAVYCESKYLPVPANLADYLKNLRPIPPRKNKQRTAYLAGPLFTLPQLWFLSEAKRCLEEQSVRVFSPKDEVGFMGSAGNPCDIAAADLKGLNASDVVFAVLDGMDAGTLFEIGFAKANRKPVICLAQNVNESDLTMLSGTDCEVYDDFSTAIYKTAWKVNKH